jgi:FkbM family methyltransferase
MYKELSQIVKAGPRDGMKRLITLGATIASGHLPEADGTHTFKVLSGANRGLWFSTQSPEQSFWGGYEPKVTNAINELTAPDSIFYDVGGNTGWDTLAAAQKMDNNGQVYVFEPSVGNIPLLKRNISANGFDANVTLVEKAVGARTEILTFAQYPNCELVNHLVTPDITAASDAVLSQMSVVSLDDFANENRLPDLIKIDIEGHEWPAIQGAQAVLDAAKPAVICEVRSDSWAMIQPFMQRLGYRSRLLGGKGRGLERGVDDALFTHPSRK